MKIGIPRALIYWKRPHFWESFFENLGFDVLLSPKTNKEIIEMGVKAADPEACFSNKVYFGHLLWLEERCDLLFVPCLKTNKEKLEYCPRFFGLPDLAKILAKTPILTATFDERKERFEKTLLRLGKKLKRAQKEVKRAQGLAILEEKKTKEEEKQDFFRKIQSKKPKIILISHPYNLQDEYVNLGIKEKLEKLGAEVISINEVPPNSRVSTNRNSRIFANKISANSREVKFHWEFGKEIMEGIQEILKYKIDGAIQISSFACGCDAVLKEFVEKKFKENKIPFLYLIIDEYTGEAGFQTRLEAFIDTFSL